MGFDPVIIGSIISAEAAHVAQESAGDAVKAVEGAVAAVRSGSVLLARVLSAAAGSILLDIEGIHYQATGPKSLVPGQMLNVRVNTVQPQLQLEILGDRVPADQHLASALKTLIGNSSSPAVSQQWRTLEQLLVRLQQLPAGEKSSEIANVARELAQLIKPVQVSMNAATMSREIEGFIERLGFDLENSLRSSATLAQPIPEQPGLKAMLARLVALVGELQTSTDTSAKGITPEVTVTQQTATRISTLLQHFQTQWAKNFSRADNSRWNSTLKSLSLAAENLQRFTGKNLVLQARSLLTALRTEVSTYSARLSIDNKAAFNSTLEQLIQDIESTFARSEGGKRLVFSLLLEDTLRSAENVRERVEAFQTLNAHMGERGQQSQILVPVSIMEELTEVQIKQFLSERKSGKSKGKNLTIVMLLNLETLGRLRIDALAQHKSLYCNIYVEKSEIVPLVESLAVEFGEQLQARGYTLARIACKTSAKKIDQFDELHGDVLSNDEGLIDMKI